MTAGLLGEGAKATLQPAVGALMAFLSSGTYDSYGNL